MKNTAIILRLIMILVTLLLWVAGAQAYDRYNDGCQNCHGAFTDETSPKGSTIPGNNKHTMHRSSSYMNTDCNLCHTSNDNRNPFLGSSDGTDINPGLGCIGCHDKFGLRAHHGFCAGCHPNDDPPPPENSLPVYYGTADTNADNPCNPVTAANLNENWTAGDFVGLDNDGDGLYDSDDPDCQAEPECTSDADCDNGAFCDGAETCDANGTCQPGTPVECSDGISCTDDICNEAADNCTNIPNNANCPDDGLFCNGVEICDPVADCSSPGDPCQPGTICNEDTNSCNQQPQCGDGNLDPGEQCDEGAANGTTACGCQIDCNYASAGTFCADAQFCNGDETCNGAGTCQPGTPVDCDDGVGCTEDLCDETNNSCVNIPSNSNCSDDGLFCNGTEFCDEINDCSSTGNPCGEGQICNEDSDTCDAAPACGDGVVDPGEQCDEGAANGATACGCQTNCNYASLGASCGDGQFCNGAETCDGAGNCQPGTPVDCYDGVGCTDDSCDEVNDSCANTPNDSYCPDDGQFCNGLEYCDPVNDCTVTGDPCGTGETCNEDADTCDAVIDLDIARFAVTKTTRLANVRPVEIKLVVRNSGSANGQSRPATVIGMQNGETVFTEMQQVSDDVGNGRSTFNFGPYTPDAPGDITWTVTIADDDPDDDTATAVTSVK